MTPRPAFLPIAAGRRLRRLPPLRPRLRAALAGAVLLATGLAAAAPARAAPADLRQLEAMVRRGDAGVLTALVQAAGSYGAQASYAEQLRYLRLLAQAHLDAGEPDAAAEDDERIERLATAQGDTLGAAFGALGQVGRLLGKDPAAALATLGSLDARYAAVEDPEFIASVQRLYGDVYVALGQFDFGLGHYLKALEIARAHPEMLAPSVAGVQLAMARLYTYTHVPDKILAMLPHGAPDGGGLAPRARARVYLYRGVAEAMLGHPARAREAYQQGYEVARRYGLPSMQADLLANIADSWLVEHRYPDAEQAALAAEAAAHAAGDAEAVRVATSNRGLALLGEGRLEEGKTVLDGVLAQMRASQSWPDLADVLAEESRALEQAGRPADALALLREREEIVTRLAASEREKTLAVLQEQFKAQQRAIQIEGLRRANADKDREIQQRRIWQLIASTGAGLALLLCGFVYRLYRRSQRTQRQLELLNTELAFHSTHDALTGLLNRRSFRERMQARAGRDGARAAPAECFVLLDIDHFKAINDRHGHGAGDEVLVEVARRLRATVGEGGLVMRWGGEEFLVYVESPDTAGHVDLVRALLDALASALVVLEGGAALAVTLTAGALSLPARGAAALPGAPSDWQQALAMADHALYKGKQDGRNRAYLIDAAGIGEHVPPQRILPDACLRPVLRDLSA